MHATRFESFLRSLTIAPSRRRALRLLAALVLGSPVALGSPNASAHNALTKCKKIADKDKRKQCKRQAKKHNAQHTNEAPPPLPGCPGTVCAGACVTCATGELIDPKTCDCCIPVDGLCVQSADCCDMAGTVRGEGQCSGADPAQGILGFCRLAV